MKSTISVQNLKKYFGSVKAVDDISFEIGEGEIMGFLGPNGAGKTTTIRCMLDFLKPNSGKIKICGFNTATNLKEIQENIGFLPSEGHLYENWTGREHINLIKKIRKFVDDEEELIAKLDFDPSKKVKNLSTGNKQKLGLILALTHKPKVLILDEPTSGLDPLLQQVIYEILKDRVQKGTTVFLSSHNLTEVEQICDRVVIINHGKVEAIESIAKIQQKKIYTIFVYFEGKVPENLPNSNLTISRRLIDGLELTYKGDIIALLDILKGYKIKDLQISHSPLEKIFLEYYK
jgi:ABC-2 type transport system ATP-binding protein